MYIKPYARGIYVLAMSVMLCMLPFLATKAFATDSKSPSTQQSNKFVVKGTVTDDTGEPAVGATVTAKGTTNAVIADIDGKFEITVPSNQTTLVFSYIGYKTKEVKASANMNIVLESDSQQLTEVVVTGITKMDKRMFTGATTKLTNDDVKIDGLSDISRSLEGRAAGVTVQNVSGTFGAAPKIRVRGATSIFGSSKPLWVVDGVILEDVEEVNADDLSSGDALTLISSAIAGLNADDIQDFQILKDGSATSIYGARAMAGVIVVTTKRGRAGSQNISYTGEFSYRMVPNYSDYNIMNSQEQMGFYKELYNKGWLSFAETHIRKNSGVYGHLYQQISAYDETTGAYGIPNTLEAKNDYLRKAEMRNTNWFNELFNHNISQNHSVGISSGTEKTQFYGSLSAMIDPGWTLKNETNRYTANFNATFKLANNLSLSILSNGSYRKQKAPGAMSQENDPVFGEVTRSFDINPYNYALNASRTLDANTFYTRNYTDFNIKHELKNNYMDLNVASFKFQGEVKWTIIPGLEWTNLGAIKYDATSTEHHIMDDSNQAKSYRAMGNALTQTNNPYLYDDPDYPYQRPISVLPEGGFFQRTDNRMFAFDFRSSIFFTKMFNDIHYVNLNAGMELNSYDRSKNWYVAWGRQYDLGDIAYYPYEYFKQGNEEGSKYFSIINSYSRKVGFYANPTYSYKQRYTLTTTVRYDGSNKLGKSKSTRWLPTWNVGLSWNAHDEEFMKPLQPAISYLKLRGSYSLTGESGPDYINNATMMVMSNTPWRPTSSLLETGLQIGYGNSLEAKYGIPHLAGFQNEDLTYEKKIELNFGLELGLLDNRISIETDVYTRKNYDLIGPVFTQILGMKYGNIATMKSHGVELSISTKNFQTRDFSWNTSFNFSYNQTKITQLLSQSSILKLVRGSGYAKQGYADRAVFSIPFAGLNEQGIPTFINQYGEVTVDDINLQEVRPEYQDFLKYEGPTNPPYNGSLGNIFTYKNFRLNVFMTYSFGNVLRLDPFFKYSYSDLDALPREFQNRWTIPGDENMTTIPVVVSKNQYAENSYLRTSYNLYNYSTERIAKGDFIRLKELSLTYNFKDKMLPKGLSNLSLKLQATNLFLLYADKKLNGSDPEFFASGGVALPMARQFTFTVRLGL